MKITFSIIVSLSFALASCGADKVSSDSNSKDVDPAENSTKQQNDPVSEVVESQVEIDTTPIFKEIDTSFTHSTLIVPEGFEVDILFREKMDMVITADSQSAPAKGNHDMIAFVPDESNSNKGRLFISHETKYADAILGDGGGATMFDIALNATGKWEVTSPFHHVSFKEVGNTDRNCGGSIGPNGMIYTCEEYMPKSNKILDRKGRGHQNMEKVGDLEYWQNIGYVVEVDPKTRKATQKMIGMGRYFHEDLEFMDDNKTVYLSDDYEPAVFFKFVADKELDYSQGQLYAFKQSEDGQSGSWITMPRDTATMIRAREAAIERGATMFMRHEWFARVGNKIYIGETGHDHTDWKNRIDAGGVPSYTLRTKHQNGTIVEDVYGRILEFDTDTDVMRPYLEGGFSSDGKKCFSNPDCVSAANIKGKDYLIIHEDINKNTKGRVPAHAEAKNHYFCELYFLDMSIKNPTVDDMMLFAVGPMNAEFTGGIMSPDGNTLFLNVQHPHRKNEEPYRRSNTVAISGWNNQ